MGTSAYHFFFLLGLSSVLVKKNSNVFAVNLEPVASTPNGGAAAPAGTTPAGYSCPAAAQVTGLATSVLCRIVSNVRDTSI